MYAQILRFTLPRLQTISSQEFRLLREATVKFCTSQYFGYTVPTSSTPLPRHKEEICWTIQWHDYISHSNRAAIISKLAQLSATPPTSLLLRVQPDHISDLTKGLEATVCEFAMCAFIPSTPFGDAEFQRSSHKTFTDCYLMRGFVGGQWGYVLDSNETKGVEIKPRIDASPSPSPSLTETETETEDPQSGSLGPGLLKDEERRLALYCLGWESTELHQAATRTPLFAEEIDKLAPYFGPGTGAFYVNFTRHG